MSVVIIGVILLVVSLAAVGIYFYLRDDKKPETSDASALEPCAETHERKEGSDECVLKEKTVVSEETTESFGNLGDDQTNIDYMYI